MKIKNFGELTEHLELLEWYMVNPKQDRTDVEAIALEVATMRERFMVEIDDLYAEEEQENVEKYHRWLCMKFGFDPQHIQDVKTIESRAKQLKKRGIKSRRRKVNRGAVTEVTEYENPLYEALDPNDELLLGEVE